MCVGNDGNVYVADYGNNRIRKITPTGVVTTLAGSTQGYADGNGTSAQFYYPSSVAVSTDGTVYVCDTQNHRIRKITPAGLVTTFSGSSQGYSDGIGASAQFNSPSGIAVLSDGTVFVCDGLNNRIRKIISDGTVTTLAGSVGGFLDGVGTSAQFSNPYAIAFASDGTAYVADFGNNRIRKITNVLSVSNFDLESNVLIYPNPFSSNLIIELKEIIATKYDIYDMHGKLLLSENIVDNNIVINTNNFCLGIYLVEIKTDKGIVSKKIIKQ